MFVINITSPLLCRCIAKQSSNVLRNVSLLQLLRPQSVLLDKSKHSIIYEFPYTKYVSYVVRTKIWVPALVTFVTPAGLLIDGIRFSVLGLFVASWLHFLVVHLMSKRASNIVGKIYINNDEECNDVIVSSMDSHGNRIDRRHKPNELIVCDYSLKTLQILGFIKIYVENTNIMYQLNIPNSKIYNKEACTELFGERWISRNQK